MEKKKEDERDDWGKEDESKDSKEKSERLADYKEHLDAIMVLKAMTDTPAWKKFYARIQTRIKTHGEEVLRAEKTRDVIRHQEGVKILNDIIDGVSAPVAGLNEFIAAMPLYSKDMNVRAEWNTAVGIVEIRNV